MLKIVGDVNGELFIEYKGERIAKVLNEYICNELFDDKQYKLLKEREKELDDKLSDLRSNIKEHLEDNIEDCIDWSRIRSEIAYAVDECLEDF